VYVCASATQVQPFSSSVGGFFLFVKRLIIYLIFFFLSEIYISIGDCLIIRGRVVVLEGNIPSCVGF